MQFKLRVNFLALGSLAVLTASLFSSFFWFFIPVAVAIWLRSANSVDRLLVVFFFLAHLWIMASFSVVDSLEILSLVLLFLMGYILRSINFKKGSFHYVVYMPMALAVLSLIGLFFGEMVAGSSVNFHSWSSGLVKSSAFPAMSEVKGLPDSVLGFYEQILIPILEKGFMAWFAFVLGLIFFINAAVDNMFKTTRKSSQAWRSFPLWKSHDLVLVALVIGLSLLALGHIFPGISMSWISSLGWHFFVLSLFPIMIQGASLASYVIPRVGAFLFLVIFALLLIEPLPVLLLAGFCDLWFDLRSKIKFQPRGEDEPS